MIPPVQSLVKYDVRVPPSAPQPCLARPKAPAVARQTLLFLDSARVLRPRRWASRGVRRT